MKKALLAVTLLLFWASFAVAQRSAIPSFVATESHEEGVLNLATLTPSINITLLSKSQGALPGSITLESPQSCQFVKEGTPPVNATACGNLYHITDHTGYLLAYFNFIDNPLMTISTDASGVTVGSCTTYTIKHLTGIDTLSAWSIPTTTLYYPSTCGNGTTTATVTTNDGSGITATLTASVSGVATSSIFNASGWVEDDSNGFGVADPFGNLVHYQASPYGFVDTLGAVTTLTNVYGGGFPYGYTDTTGTAQSITATNGTATTFQNSSCGTGWNGTSVTPISSINFPDSTKVSFTWDTNGTGIDGLIKSVTLRTGGTITYTYGTQNCGNATPFYFSTLSRATADGTWTYTIGTWTSGTTTTVLDPGKNKVVYQFYGSLTAANTPLFTQSVTRYQNTGSVGTPAYTEISAETYCYNTSCTAAPTLPITTLEIKSYLGSTPTFMSDETKTFDNTYGLLKTDATTDEITSQTITTTYVYGTDSSGTCVAITNTNIQDHPCTITTKNGSTWLSGSTYSYNGNGALTSSSACLSSTCTGSSALTTTYTPTTHGTYSAIQDPNGQTVNYTYGSCNSLMPTDVTTTVNSVAIDNKATWNCDAGLVTDTTDPNSNEADYTYDSMNRLSTYHDYMGDTNTTSYAYGTPTLDHVKVTDNIGVVSYVYNDGLGRPTNSQVCQTSGCSNLDTSSMSYAWNGVNFETKTYVPCTKTTLNSACTTVALTSDVNPIMGPYQTTDANSGTGTYAVNSKDFSFTAGPAPSQENTKVVQTEVDGFGRITSTCAITASGYNGRVSCGQTMGNSGTLTSNTYSFATGAPKVVTTRGSQSHTIIADELGRTTSVTIPEATGGAATDVYDTVSTADNCYAANATSKGDLMHHNNADSSYVCFKYDGLHRPTYVGNSIDTSTSPCRRYQYDSTANNFQTAPTGYPSSGANIIGRVFEAETDNCTSPYNAITDEWFAYDKMGRMTDMWESTPNSGGYYHTTVSYDADGMVTGITNIPLTTWTITYGLDGEERPNAMSISASGGTTIVSATAGNGFKYDAASRPTNVPVGSNGDQDTYTYDNVGNMTEYTFDVNSTTDDGKLTWNSIGSLNKLVITDGFNSGGSQTCTYGTSTVEGYDDVGRILDANCGSSIQHDSWTYDQYDNANRTGNPGTSWSSSYSSTTNQFTLTGATYDSNGDLTYDGVNSYSWNVYGQIAGTVSGNHTISCSTSGNYCPAYDAFGRVVEADNGSANAEILYSPIGRIAYMNQQASIGVLYVPAPGGGDLYVTGGTMYFLHPDWLGTKRLSTSLSGRAEQYDTAFTPYGEAYDTFGTLVPDFTGLTQDLSPNVGGNIGLFSTPTRQLATNSSRWLSPDPAHSGWNAYAYPTDPNTQTDPSGLRACNSSDQACVTANADDIGSSLAVAMQIYCINGCEGFGPLIFNSPNRSGVTCVLCGMPEGATLGTMNIGGNAHGSAMFFNNFSGTSPSMATPIVAKYNQLQGRLYNAYGIGVTLMTTFALYETIDWASYLDYPHSLRVPWQNEVVDVEPEMPNPSTDIYDWYHGFPNITFTTPQPTPSFWAGSAGDLASIGTMWTGAGFMVLMSPTKMGDASFHHRPPGSEPISPDPLVFAPGLSAPF